MTEAQEFGIRFAQERREKAVRDRTKLLQADIAKAVGVSETTVSRWEAGVVMPKEGALARVAQYFGVTVPWLRYGVEPRHPATPEPKLTIPRKRASGDRHDR